MQLQEKADKVVGKGVYTDTCSLSLTLHSHYVLSGTCGGENTLSLSFQGSGAKFIHVKILIKLSPMGLSESDLQIKYLNK